MSPFEGAFRVSEFCAKEIIFVSKKQPVIKNCKKLNIKIREALTGSDFISNYLSVFLKIYYNFTYIQDKIRNSFIKMKLSELILTPTQYWHHIICGILVFTTNFLKPLKQKWRI